MKRASKWHANTAACCSFQPISYVMAFDFTKGRGEGGGEFQLSYGGKTKSWTLLSSRLLPRSLLSLETPYAPRQTPANPKTTPPVAPLPATALRQETQVTFRSKRPYHVSCLSKTPRRQKDDGKVRQVSLCLLGGEETR